MSSPFADDNVVGETEYGGKAGLVQSEEDGHTATPSERIGMVYRTSATDVDAIDPVTGRSAVES